MTVSVDVKICDGSALHGPEPNAQAIQKPSGRSAAVLATLQVNLRCNSACGYCDLPLNVGRYEMTRKEMRGVFSCLYRDGIRFVLVQGGEPLLRRDVPEILKNLSAIGVHLTLITNGRIGRGTVIGQTMLIILRNSTVSIAPTGPGAGETGRTGGAFLPLWASKPIEVSTFLEWPDI
jgi:MoaA/NifB/PqqE/SkfB family radical SAM enzyme